MNVMRRTLPAFFLGFFGTLYLFHEIPLTNVNHTLWASDFDPKFILWTVEWVYHAIFQKHLFLDVWNSNSGYPALNTLAFSDPLLSIQLFYAPLRGMGVGALASLYCSLAGFCVLGCLLTNLALERIGGFQTIEKLAIIFCAHFSLFVTPFLPHYQLFGFELAPSFFLFLYLFLRNPNGFDLFLTTLIYCLAFGFSMYLGPMLLSVAIFEVLWFFKTEKSVFIRTVFTQVGTKAWVFVATCLGLLYFVLLRPYLSLAAKLTPQSFDDSANYSATWQTLFIGKSSISYFHPGSYTHWGEWESTYFPGYLILGVILVFLILALKDRAKFKAPLVGFMLVLFFTSYLLSLGPFMDRLGRPPIFFYWLSKVIPGLRNVRSPGRFGMFLGLPVGFFLVTLWRLASEKMSSAFLKKTLFPAVLVLIIIESVPNYPVMQFKEKYESIYESLPKVLEEHTPLIELPIAGKDYVKTIGNVMDQLVGSTHHWAWLVSSYAAQPPTAFLKLTDLDSQLGQGKSQIADMISFGKRNFRQPRFGSCRRVSRKSQRKMADVYSDSRFFAHFASSRRYLPDSDKKLSEHPRNPVFAFTNPLLSSGFRLRLRINPKLRRIARRTEM